MFPGYPGVALSIAVSGLVVAVVSAVAVATGWHGGHADSDKATGIATLASLAGMAVFLIGIAWQAALWIAAARR